MAPPSTTGKPVTSLSIPPPSHPLADGIMYIGNCRRGFSKRELLVIQSAFDILEGEYGEKATGVEVLKTDRAWKRLLYCYPSRVFRQPIVARTTLIDHNLLWLSLCIVPDGCWKDLIDSYLTSGEHPKHSHFFFISTTYEFLCRFLRSLPALRTVMAGTEKNVTVSFTPWTEDLTLEGLALNTGTGITHTMDQLDFIGEAGFGVRIDGEVVFTVVATGCYRLGVVQSVEVPSEMLSDIASEMSNLNIGISC